MPAPTRKLSANLRSKRACPPHCPLVAHHHHVLDAIVHDRARIPAYIAYQTRRFATHTPDFKIQSPQKLSAGERAGAARAAKAGITPGQAIMTLGLGKKAVFAVGGTRPYCMDMSLIQLVNPLPEAHLGNYEHLDQDPEDIKRYFGKLGTAIRSFLSSMPCDEVRRDSNRRLFVIAETDGGTVGRQIAALRDEVRENVEEAGFRARKGQATIDKEIEEATWVLVDTGVRVWVEVWAADESLGEDRVWANQMLSYVGMEWAHQPQDLIANMLDLATPAAEIVGLRLLLKSRLLLLSWPKCEENVKIHKNNAITK